MKGLVSFALFDPGIEANVSWQPPSGLGPPDEVKSGHLTAVRRTRVLLGAVALVSVVGFALYGLRDGLSSEDHHIVARVGETGISVDRFVKEYRRHLLSTGQKDSPRLRQRFLGGMINKALLVSRARQEGVASGPEFAFAHERIRRKLLIDAYTAEVIYDEVTVADDDLLDMFARMNTQLKARHLYSRTLEAAERLYDRLQSGESFEDLAREIFQDSTLASSGGSVGYFRFDEMDPAFEDAAYSLKPGEVSRPVRTAQGYSIIQLQDRFLHPLLTETEFANRKDRVRQYAEFRKRVDARRNHVKTLLEDLDVTIVSEAAGRLWERIRDDRLPGPGDEDGLLSDTLARFTVSGRPIALTGADFRDAAVFSSQEQLASITSPDALSQFIEGLIAQEEMTRRALAMSLDEKPLFVETESEAVEDWIYEAYRNRFARGVEVAEDSVRDYFRRFGHEFVVPERRLVWEILVDGRPLAQEMLERSTSEPFEQLASEFSLRPGARLAGGSLGYVSRDQLGLLAESVFATAEGEVIGPFEIAGRYAVLKVGDTAPARRAALDEVRGHIRERLRVEGELRLLRYLVVDLRNKITTQVVDSVLYSVPLTSQAPPDPQ